MTGHSQAQHMVESQPMKMAAAEAHWETEDPASMTIFTMGITSRGSEAFAIKLPGLLSIMACDNLDCEVQGINDLQRQYEEEFGPGNYIPPVGITYWSFRIMVGVGFLMLLIILYALLLVMGEQLENNPRFLKYFPFFIVLPYLANTTGWILTEVGRFPWIVYGLMTIEDGVSIAVPLSAVALSLIVFTLIYGALMVAGIYLMIRYAGGTSPKLAEPIPVPEPAASLIGGSD
jgi:cytochrome d ubiquinol oxidase subunit I